MFILQPLGTLINRNVKGKWKAKERLKRMSLNDYVHVTDKKSKFTKQIFSQKYAFVDEIKNCRCEKGQIKNEVKCVNTFATLLCLTQDEEGSYILSIQSSSD